MNGRSADGEKDAKTTLPRCRTRADGRGRFTKRPVPSVRPLGWVYDLDARRMTLTAEHPPPKLAELDAFNPLKPEERVRVRALGKAIQQQRAKWFRGSQRVSRKLLARACGMSEGGLAKIEQGTRRTRLSTLRRIADALAELRPPLGPSRAILGRLLFVANGAIAAEPQCLPTSKRGQRETHPTGARRES